MTNTLDIKTIEQRYNTVLERVRSIPQDVLRNREAIERQELKLGPMREEAAMLALAIQAGNINELEEKQHYLLSTDIKSATSSIRKHLSQIDALQAEYAVAEKLASTLATALLEARDVHERKVAAVMVGSLSPSVVEEAREALAALMVSTCIKHTLRIDELLIDGLINTYLQTSSTLLTKRAREMLAEAHATAEKQVA